MFGGEGGREDISMKSMMVNRTNRSWWMVALVGAVLALMPLAQAQAQTAPPTPAPDPAAIAEQCRAEIAATTRDGVKAIYMGARKTIEHIAMLAQEGAPPQVIWRAAFEGKKQIAALTRAHVARINAVTQRCVDVLRNLNADPPLIRSVLEARAKGIAHLGYAYKAACNAVLRAARRATAVPNTPGGLVLSDSGGIG